MLISFRIYLRSFCLLLDPDLKPVPWQIQNQRWTLKKSVNIYEHFKMGPVFHGALIFVPYCKDEQGYHHIAVSVSICTLPAPAAEASNNLYSTLTL